MPIHNTAAPEIALEEVNYNELRPRRDVHELLLILDLRIRACPLISHLFGTREFRMKLLQALFAQSRKRMVVLLFQGCHERIFVIRITIF